MTNTYTIGQTFGFYTLVEDLGIRTIQGRRIRYLLCRCVCGVEKEVRAYAVKRHNRVSCGCKRGEGIIAGKGSHGLSATPEYKRWKTIKARCFNPNNKSYWCYGAKGITMCDEWKDDFMAFLNHIGEMPNSRSEVDRIDNTKGYYPGNVRWSSRKEQTRNILSKSNNTTGFKGVSYREKVSRAGSLLRAYVATWTDLCGKQRSKEFSVNKYGEELSFFLACEYREYQINILNLQGAGYTQQHIYGLQE